MMRSPRRRTTRHSDRTTLSAPRSSGSEALDALRRGREALTDIEGQLDNILAWLASPTGNLDASTPDRLAGRARDAGDALANLAALSGLAPQRA